MAIARAYLSLGGMTFRVFGILSGIFMTLSGGFILMRQRDFVKFVYAAACSFFFGYLCFTLGLVIIMVIGPLDPVRAMWVLLGMTIGISTLGIGIGFVFVPIGEIMIGCASGWGLWTLVAGLIPSDGANLIISTILATAGGALAQLYNESLDTLIVSWLGSMLVTIGFSTIAVNSLLINNIPTDAVAIGSFAIYIIAILLTFVLFAVDLYRNRKIPEEKGIKSSHIFTD